MSLVNGIPTPPITMTDISSCIGVASKQLGVLAGNAVINKWAFHKPFQSNAKAFASDAEREEYMRSATMGFSIPSAVNLNTFLSIWNQQWTHIRPTSNYRMLDFKGYRHTAPPWSEGTLSGRYLYLAFDSMLSAPRAPLKATAGDIFTLDMFGASPALVRGDYLYPTDFFNGCSVDLRDWYCGLAFINAQQNSVYYITNDTQMKNTNETASVSTAIPNVGSFPVGSNFYVVPIMCSQSRTTLTDMSSVFPGEVVTLNGRYMTVERVSGSGLITVSSGGVYVSGTAKVDITIGNTFSEAKTVPLFGYIVSEHTVDYEDYSGAYDQADEWVAYGTIHNNGIYDGSMNRLARYKNYGNVTVPANSSVTITLDYGYASDDLGYPYNAWAEAWICYTANGTRVMTV